MHDFWRLVYGESGDGFDLQFRLRKESADNGLCLGHTSNTQQKCCAPPKIKLAITKKCVYKIWLDCFTNNGMVSVVFFLIIAYRPLIQSPLLNTALRLAGEDYYREVSLWR
jgi:hypothetical protein